MHITVEQQEHYNFYLDNLDEGEVPVGVVYWVIEYWTDVETILNKNNG